MCEPISMGIAIGAATGAVGAAITGGDVLQGALMGGVTGGFTGGMGGLSGGGSLASLGQAFGATPGVFINSMALNTAAMGGMAIAGLGTSVGMGLLFPPAQPYEPYATTHEPYKLYNYNTPEYEVTGSGGRQAPAVLAEQIKNVKQRRAKQEDQGDLGLTTLQDTGLQFA